MRKRNALALLAGAALIGCSSMEEGNPAKPETPVAESSSTNSVSGTKVFEEKITGTAGFSVYKQGDRYLMLSDAHMDKDEKIIPVVREAMQKTSLVEAYKTLQTLKVVPTEVPSALAELDEENRRNGAEDPRKAGKGSLEGEEMGGVAGDLGPVKALAKTAAEEPDWDWEEDANWFKGLVRDRYDAEHEHFRTNITYAWVSREGFKHYAAGMAASHIATTRFRGWYEECFFDCWWEESFDRTIQPRYLSFATYSSKYGNHIKVRVDGAQPSPRSHLALLWNTDDDFTPSPTADLSVSISSFSNNSLKWSVKNSGKTNITNPWVKLVYKTAGGNVTDEWQIPVTLTPGQVYNDSRYEGDSILGVTITIDSKGLIAESNESNNITTRSHAP